MDSGICLAAGKGSLSVKYHWARKTGRRHCAAVERVGGFNKLTNGKEYWVFKQLRVTAALAQEFNISVQNLPVKSSRLEESIYILSDVYINNFFYGLQ